MPRRINSRVDELERGSVGPVTHDKATGYPILSIEDVQYEVELIPEQLRDEWLDEINKWIGEFGMTVIDDALPEGPAFLRLPDGRMIRTWIKHTGPFFPPFQPPDYMPTEGGAIVPPAVEPVEDELSDLTEDERELFNKIFGGNDE